MFFFSLIKMEDQWKKLSIIEFELQKVNGHEKLKSPLTIAKKLQTLV